MKSAKNSYYAYLIPRENKHGITDNWKECEKLVSGVFGARYRGFKTHEEAKEWLRAGAHYDLKPITYNLQPGIYFDAGTGRGNGVEVSVTDEKGKNLLHKVISKDELNKHGKHLVGKEVTNNYGELLGMKYALQLAIQEEIKKIFGDSKLVIDYWSKWHVKKDVAEETKMLAHEVAKLRAEFEESGGVVHRVSGDDNPADLGFH